MTTDDRDYEAWVNREWDRLWALAPKPPWPLSMFRRDDGETMRGVFRCGAAAGRLYESRNTTQVVGQYQEMLDRVITTSNQLVKAVNRSKHNHGTPIGAGY